MDTFSPSDPLVKVFLKNNRRDGSHWVEIGETEKIENDADPNFVKFFEMDYFFEKRQELKFECHDVDIVGKRRELGLIGQCETTLGKVIGSP